MAEREFELTDAHHPWRAPLTSRSGDSPGAHRVVDARYIATDDTGGHPLPAEVLDIGARMPAGFFAGHVQAVSIAPTPPSRRSKTRIEFKLRMKKKGHRRRDGGPDDGLSDRLVALSRGK
jgi:hypothetical protein